jgi:DNA-binding response OmpR family regulator
MRSPTEGAPRADASGLPSIILIVESDFSRSLLIESAFSRNGVSVRTVRSGQSARCYIDGLPPYSDRDSHPSPAMVFVDLGVADGSGLDLLSWIRQESAQRDIPVIAYGDFEAQFDLQQTYDLGASACFPRQYGIIKIISAVKELDWVDDIVRRIKS